MNTLKTIGQFILEEQKKFYTTKGTLTHLLNDIIVAAKIVNSQVNKAGLVNILGDDGNTNVHGESVKKLDVFANEQFIKAMQLGDDCCLIASEENEEVVHVNKDAKYVLYIDPLDGSSNIDINAPIGTIFSIYHRITEVGTECDERDYLQRGENQVCAGFFYYGTSTMLVYTTGNGVNGFTLYPSVGDFFLSHPDMKIPDFGNIYSINEGNYVKFTDGVKKYIKWCQEEDKATQRPYSTRYIGSMIADVYRTTIKGGIFIYPSGTGYPKGKLRLMYECNPMSFIIEQAGGTSVDESGNRILEIEPDNIHQRTPIFIGSKDNVDRIKTFLKR